MQTCHTHEAFEHGRSGTRNHSRSYTDHASAGAHRTKLNLPTMPPELSAASSVSMFSEEKITG